MLGSRELPRTVVSDVSQDAPAAKAGLLVGDVVLAVADVDCTSAQDFSDAWDAVPAGKRTQLLVWRDGARVEVQVKGGRLGAVFQDCRAKPE